MDQRFDIVIVGGGVAGLACALSTSDGTRVVVVDKGEAGAGSSPLAQGGIAAAVGPDDSPALHAEDTLGAGAGLCDEAVVRDICAEGPDVVAWLVKLGCAFDRGPDGELDLAREGGQSMGRSVHWADATGAEIVRALRVTARGRAERVRARATALLVRGGRCAGVLTEAGPIFGRGVLLATGGAGAMWAATTNAPGATGDGIALALGAGALVADLEFMQFHPTALDDGSPTRALLTEALRGAGAILVDAAGVRFVDELAPRHVVTRAVLERGRAWLDCRPVPRLSERFPTVVAGARARGFDPTSEPLPVSPAAHYFIGGVAVDSSGRTSIPGLFAAGECAASGMHGANRMAGNSLLEAIVLGRRAAGALASEPETAGALASEPESAGATVPERRPGIAGRQPAGRLLDPPHPDLPGLMWRGCGPFRNQEGLGRCIDALERLPESLHRELCALIARSALARRESRGVHMRMDFPQPDPGRAARRILP